MITLFPISGLCNRMRAIESTIVLCEKSQTPLKIFWVTDPKLNCSFSSLFKPILLSNLSFFDFSSIPYKYRILNDKSHKLNKIVKHFLCDIHLDHFDCKQLKTDNYQFDELLNFKQVVIFTNDRLYRNSKEYKYFKPTEELENQINKRTVNFSTNTIGVHLRRTDHIISIKNSPTELFIDAMHQEIEINPETTFYLASDSVLEKKTLIREFDERIITSFKNNSRDTVDGIKEALIDLYALSKTKMILGSSGSSFSRTAADISGIEEKTIDFRDLGSNKKNFFISKTQKIITGINGGDKNCTKRALIYYKIDPLINSSLVQSYSHTNNSEILLLIDVLKSFGFSIDFIDGKAGWEEINVLSANEYNLYIADCAACGYGFHTRILQHFRIKSFIAYATIMHPKTQNQITNKLLEDTKLKYPEIIFEPVRLIKLSDSEFDFDKRFSSADSILYFGSDFTVSTYSHLNKPMYRINPAVSPRVKFDITSVDQKSSRNFLFMCGGGTFQKGLLNTLEAFSRLKDCNLHIFAGSKGNLWDNATKLGLIGMNIFHHGFVQVGNDLFNEVTDKCAFIIAPSFYDGGSTSVATAMRKGLIPIVSKETGVNIDDFGFLIDNRNVENMIFTIKKVASLEKPELLERALKTYHASSTYDAEGYKDSIARAISKSVVKC